MNKLSILLGLAAMVVAGPAIAQPNLCNIHPNLPQCDQGGDEGDEGGNVNVDTDVDVDVDTNVIAKGGDADATAFGFNAQKQGQQQAQSQGNSQTLVVEDRVAASSSASLYLGTCQAGVSAQTLQGGGALGSPDEVCLLFTASQVASAQGRSELAEKLLDEAVDILQVRSNPVRRLLQGLPLLGRVM